MGSSCGRGRESHLAGKRVFVHFFVSGFSFLFFFLFSRFLNSHSLLRPHSLPHPSQDFPYNFEDGIEHSNVWALAPLAPRQLEAFVEERRPHCDFETAWFVNPVALASIPDVWHAHVLSKRRRRKEGEGVEEKGA